MCKTHIINFHKETGKKIKSASDILSIESWMGAVAYI